ncbi:MAG: hypothetical protein ABIR08_13100 [Sphingomonas sp.]
MVTLSIVMMLSASAALSNFTLPPAKPRKCAGACAARYRIPASASDGYSIKDRALADDGSKCNVVGAKRCTSKRHTVLRSTEDPMDTWRSALGKN